MSKSDLRLAISSVGNIANVRVARALMPYAAGNCATAADTNDAAGALNDAVSQTASTSTPSAIRHIKRVRGRREAIAPLNEKFDALGAKVDVIGSAEVFSGTGSPTCDIGSS